MSWWVIGGGVLLMVVAGLISLGHWWYHNIEIVKDIALDTLRDMGGEAFVFDLEERTSARWGHEVRIVRMYLILGDLMEEGAVDMDSRPRGDRMAGYVWITGPRRRREVRRRRPVLTALPQGVMS